MSLASLFSISTQGMQAQSTRLSAQANNIANLQSTGYSRSPCFSARRRRAASRRG